MIDYQQLADFYGKGIEWEMQFRHCQAWLSITIYCSAYDITFTLMKSYNTVVAVIDHTNEKFVRLGKWSTTTSKQSTQIHNSLYPSYEDIQL